MTNRREPGEEGEIVLGKGLAHQAKVGSPVFAYISEKTESILEGRDFPFSFKQLMKDAWRGIKLALRNAVWQSIYIFSLLLLSLLPLVGWISPLIALLVECYYYGFSMLDYSCERNKLSPSQSIEFIGRKSTFTGHRKFVKTYF